MKRVSWQPTRILDFPTGVDAGITGIGIETRHDAQGLRGRNRTVRLGSTCRLKTPELENVARSVNRTGKAPIRLVGLSLGCVHQGLNFGFNPFAIAHVAAREKQTSRMRDMGVTCDARMGAKAMREFCERDTSTKDLLKAAIAQFNLSGRDCDRTLKVSRTIVDLEGAQHIEMHHVAEAINSRAFDRKLSG